jgi:lysophosphatidic acid acyltransferase/lysophosphatidylinositol acyltransferase
MTCIEKFRNTHVKYLYDLTICYLNARGELVPAPSIVKVHSQSIKNDYKFHIHVRKFLLKDLPESDPELLKFLIDLSVEKDMILSQFCKAKDHEHAPLPDNLRIELPNKSD